jgi:tetratricopeptide (TPR) repeat protein
MNAETAYAIGDAYRVQSSEGGKNYRELVEQAREWFGRSIKLNPWRGDGYAGCGWCLDWLGRTAESGKYFERAAELEPNGYFMAANIGRHYVEAGDFAAAKPWFERSLSLDRDNPVARNYLQIVNSRMQEAATNEMSARLNFPSQ